MTMINKKFVRDAIYKNSKKSQIGEEVVPYIDRTMITLLYAIISAINQNTTPDDNKTLKKDEVKEALFLIDEYYGLQGMDDLELDIENYDKKPINVNPTAQPQPIQSSQGRQVLDINININDERKEKK